MLLSILKALIFYTDINDHETCEALIAEGNRLCNNSESLNESALGKDFSLKKSIYYLKLGRLDKTIAPEDIQFDYAFLKEEINWYSANYYAHLKNIDKTVAYYDKLIKEKRAKETRSREIVYSNIEEKYINKKLNKENQELTKNIESKQRNLVISISMLMFILSLLVLQFINNHRHKKLNDLLQINRQELEKSNKELAVSNEELERFIFIASHDLKTPIRNIVSFTNLLEKRLKSSTDENVHDYISFIKNGGIRLNNLIEDSLEYSKISNKEYYVENKKVDLNQLIDELEFSVSNDMLTRNAKIIKLNHLPTINAHHASLVILFQNLIENGIKYNKSDTPIIQISSKRDEDFCFIHVEDNGIGIPYEYREQVFIMFSRLQNSEEYEGSGLGLASCRKIMEQLNGSIKLSSKKEKGSIFDIKFPTKMICTEEINI